MFLHHHFRILYHLTTEALTHYSTFIQPMFTWSKWNMGEIFGLKFHTSYVNTPSTKKVIFVTEFMILVQNSSFYEENKRRNFKSIFSRPVVIIIFRPKNGRISPIFHFDWVNDGWITHIFCEGGHTCSIRRTNLVSHRTFRRPLFFKPVSWQGLSLPLLK